MSKTEKTGFHTLRARSEDKLPDLLKFRNHLDAKTDGILFIKDTIDGLLWQMHIRLNQPRFEPLADHDRFARSTLYAGFDLIAPVFGIRTEDIPIRAVLADIKGFLPRLAQLVSEYLSVDSSAVSRLSQIEWAKISVALSKMREVDPTLSEAFALASILKWNASNVETATNEANKELVADFLQHIEDAFLDELHSAATHLTSAITEDDISRAITIILEIRANFILDSDLLSSQFAARVATQFREIALAFGALQKQITTTSESLAEELSSCVLTMNWANADIACARLWDIAKLPHIELALDVNDYINFIKMKRAASFAAFLYAGPARLALTQREQGDDCTCFREMQDQVEYEHLPTGTIRNLLNLVRTNEAGALLLLAKSLSVKDLLPGAQKTIKYILTSSHWTAPLASTSLLSFNIGEEDSQDVLLTSKFIFDWFVPPLLVSALQLPDERGMFAVIEANHVFDWSKVLKECNIESCAFILRALDQAYPDHSPILFGHIVNFYTDILGSHGAIPSDIDVMLKVIRELYGSKPGNIRNRLQRSLLHSQALSVIEKVETDEAKSFLRRCYERSGFIVTDEFCAQLGKSLVPGSLATGQLSVVHLQIPSNMAKGWEKYHDRYYSLKGVDTQAVAADKFIAKEARALVGQIIGATFTEKNPLRNYTSPRVAKGLVGHGDILDILIQRRAILRWAQVCELRRDDKANSQKRTRFFQSMGYGTSNLESYSNYFHAIGLKLENLVEPDESGFFPEELTWLKSFRTRK